ncbi:flagellar basal-body rod protein FlgG [Herbaspirillum frisingense]|uniref:flagellar basal-body rod protein FlgG n=1 Tax=Herbaspirillum frisingense TaxID=92645 RepID=UPI001602E025|nr:flagellar basal-body rod protein FlgG [Herbaspirillum frisingense]QNB08843.1 flagellar basal-body rod protein FlgG [Herbaspirillum frisingense]
MHDALYIGATGMQAQQLNVDTIANNLANVNTTGYKKGRVNFSDLVVSGGQPLLPSAAVDGNGGIFGDAYRTGAGVGIANLGKLFDLGDIKKTDSALDVAIQGDGFLEVTMPDGSHAYTRGGTLKVNADGLLATQAGYPLSPGIAVPSNVKSLTIGTDGKVTLVTADQSTPVEAGTLAMVRFTSPGMLNAQGDNLYRATDGSGEPIAGKPGEDSMGLVQQGFLEGSNVKMVEEMVNLMVAQRAYEASVKVVQASDEMLGMVNNLRR